MKILLTGSNGFLGKYIINTIGSHCDIISLNRSNSDINCNLAENTPILSSYDLVIHSAGKAHSTYKDEISFFFDVNVMGTLNLLNGIEKSGSLPKYFVFISTVAVYGLEKGTNINENFPLNAIEPYGLSKLKAEMLILDWCNKNNVICSILRLPLLIGENPTGNLESMIKGIKKGYYFNVSDGCARKSMVHAKDVASILLKVSKIGGVYNLTDGYHPSVFELSFAIARQFGKIKLINFPYYIARFIAAFGDVVGERFPFNSKKLRKLTSDLTFDDSNARQVLGWKPKNVLDYYGI